MRDRPARGLGVVNAVLFTLATVSCGRIGFDLTPVVDGSVDGSVSTDGALDGALDGAIGNRLGIAPVSAVLAVNERTNFRAFGGTGPYSFSVQNGGGTVDGTSGSYLAPPGVGMATIRVTDADGNTAEAALTLIDPLAFAGLAGWWKADALALSDRQSVSTWPDSSGNGFAATQGTPARQPIYVADALDGMPGVRFDGTSHEIGTTLVPATGSDPRMLVAVVSDGSALGVQSVIMSYGSTDLHYNSYGIAHRLDPARTRGSHNMGGFYHCSVGFQRCSDSLQPPSVAPLILVLAYDGATDRFYVNGVLKVERSATLNTDTNWGVLFGTHVPRGSDHWSGDLHEAFAFSGAISDADRQLLECGLSAKYGISVDNSLLCGGGALGLTGAPHLTLQAGTSTTIRAQGGAPPYRYELSAGDGSIDANTGVLTAPGNPQQLTVRVVDGVGTSAEKTIEVVAFPAPQMWLKADAIAGLADAQGVLEWRDRSGQEHHVQNDEPAEQPTYRVGALNALPVVRFSGSLKHLHSGYIPVTGAGGRTFLAVIANGNPGYPGRQEILSYGYNNRCNEGYAMMFGTTNTTPVNIGGAYSCSQIESSVAPSSAPMLITQIYSATRHSFWINGVDAGASNRALDTQPVIGLTVGQYWNGGQEFDGDIAEALVYETALSVSDRMAVEAYLRGKYALP